MPDQDQECPQEESGVPGVRGIKHGLRQSPFRKSLEEFPDSPNPSGNGGPTPVVAALQGVTLPGTRLPHILMVGVLPNPFPAFVEIPHSQVADPNDPLCNFCTFLLPARFLSLVLVTIHTLGVSLICLRIPLLSLLACFVCCCIPRAWMLGTE